MGSNYETAGGQSPRQTLGTYSKYLPQLTDLVNQGIPATAQAQLKAANQQVNPGSNDVLGLNALNLEQLQRYAIPEAQVGQDVARSNALAGAETNRQQLAGAGGAAARSATSLNRELNPAYYSAIDAAGKGASDAIGAINLKGLSPGEAAATERSLNQTNTSTGNAGLVNPTTVVANAMNFGGAFNNKIGLMNQAVNSAANVGNVAAGGGGVNPVSIALGQPNPTTATNFGAGQFTNTSPTSAAGPASNAFNFGSSLYSSLTGSNASAQSAGANMAGQTSPAAYVQAV